MLSNHGVNVSIKHPSATVIGLYTGLFYSANNIDTVGLDAVLATIFVMPIFTLLITSVLDFLLYKKGLHGHKNFFL